MITLRSLIDEGCGTVGGLKKISKTYSQGVGIVRKGEGVWKKLKILIAGEEWILDCFFLSFPNRENYSIKNICIYSKSSK